MTESNDTKRRRELIRSRMFISRISQSDIARREGVTRGLVCNVIAGRRTNRAVQVALADVVGMEPTELWEN